MLIVCASVSGSPGVSSVALGLAARWPGRPGVLVEADPAGGVAAARFGLAQQPGLTSLAAQARHGAHTVQPDQHLQRIPALGVDVVASSGSRHAATGAVEVLARQGPTTLGVLAPVVVVDAGRLTERTPTEVGGPVAAILSSADAVLLLTRPGTEYLDHLDHRLPALRAEVRRGRLGLVLVGAGGFPVADIAGRLSVPVWARLPHDRWGAGVLAGRLTGRGWARTRLARAVAGLAVTLDDLAYEPVGAAR